MVVDALRAYVQLASGLTEVTRERAVSAAKALVAQVGSMSDAPAESTAQVRALADELAKTARANRDLVIGMVRAETERAVGSVGVASTEDVVALQRRVADLEEKVAELGKSSGGGPASAKPKKATKRAAATSAHSTDDAGGSATGQPSDGSAESKTPPGLATKSAKKSATKAAKDTPAAPDPEHATPADMPQHHPADAGAVEPADAGHGADGPEAAQDPSPPDVSTS